MRYAVGNPIIDLSGSSAATHSDVRGRPRNGASAPHGRGPRQIRRNFGMDAPQPSGLGLRGPHFGAIDSAWNSPWTDLELRALEMGFDPASQYAVVCISFVSDAGTAQVDALESARAAVRSALYAQRKTALESWTESEVTLLLPVAEKRTLGMVKALLLDLHRFTRTLKVAPAITCGIAGVCRTLADVRDHSHEAAVACRLGRAMNGLGSTTEYGSLGAFAALYEALIDGRSAAALADLQERYLGAASRYEAETGLPLMETLLMFFAERGNASATARSLGINRQSLLYRLARLESLAGIDLASPMDRFAMELAVHCWRVRPERVDSVPAGGY
jgi:sugar diacid utilization regulator